MALSGCVDDRVRLVDEAMAPTIKSGEYARFDSNAYVEAEPQVGDIVEAYTPVGAAEGACGLLPRRGEPCRVPTDAVSGDATAVSRIVAGPGSEVAFDRAGMTIRDGDRQVEPFITRCERRDRCALPRAIKLPAKRYYLVGDNRPFAVDSRIWGPVRRSSILGKFYPPGTGPPAGYAGD